MSRRCVCLRGASVSNWRLSYLEEIFCLAVWQLEKILFGSLYIKDPKSTYRFSFHPAGPDTVARCMDMQQMQPPPPPAGRSAGKRASVVPAQRGPLSPYLNTDEHVKSNLMVRLSRADPTMVRSKTLFQGMVVDVKQDGEIFAILFSDGQRQDVPAAWIQRRDFSKGRTWAEVDADEKGMRGSKKKRQKKRKAEGGQDWRLDALQSAFVLADADPEEGSSMLDRLVFRATVSYKMHGKFVQREVPEEVSLRSMLEGQASAHEVDMYVKAMYDMMQMLFHETPTEARRLELLGGVDPFDGAQDRVAADRAEIYAQHSRLAALGAAAGAAQGGGAM